QDIQNPVVPAGQETRVAAPVFMSKVTERAGHRLLDDHLAQLAHDQKGDKATDGIAEDHRRAGAFHYPSRSEEQTGTDGAPQRDQLDMAILQAPLERAGMQNFTHKFPWNGAGTQA